MENKQTEKEDWEGEVADVVKDEANDKPAGRGIWVTIIIAVVILVILYFIFFDNNITF